VEDASSKLYKDTEIIMDAQTELKEYIKRAVFDASIMVGFKRKIPNIVKSLIKDVQNEDLRERAYKSLVKFAFNEFDKLVQELGMDLNWVLIVALLDQQRQKLVSIKQVQGEIDKTIKDIGKVDYFKAFSNLGNSQAKTSKNHSLYGTAELTARFEEQQKMIEDLKKETKLVVCSTHSDCSERCSHWQGKVYSLDGTSGKTNDGRNYEPLENAVNVYDKYGNKNGLLGFNCRHKLIKYEKGVKPVFVSKKEREREYNISQMQRALEREIRANKDLYYTFRDVKLGKEKAKEYRDRTIQLTGQYKEFCKEYGRTEYRSRLKV